MLLLVRSAAVIIIIIIIIIVIIADYYCGRQEELAILISTLLLQTHARQLYSLALTRFYSIRESSTTNAWNVWNVIESESVSLGLFLFMSRLMPFCGLILPQASCDLFFLDLKREARVLFVLYLKSLKSEIVVHPICLSLIALFLLGAGFHTNKIILLYHNRDVFTAAFRYVKISF